VTTETLDDITFRLFGHRITDALAASRCVRCWRAVGEDYLDELAHAMYRLWGVCPDCYEEEN
jgi:hypothetical protein